MMTPGKENETDNGWPEYRMWVKEELLTHGKKLEIIEAALNEVQTQISGLKIRVAIASAVAASIISAVVTLTLKRLIG